jgi:hypothetical protein
MPVDSPYIGYWMATVYGVTGRRADYRLFLNGDGTFQRWTCAEPTEERLDRGQWEHRRDGDAETILLKSESPSDMDWTRNAYRVLSINTCEDSNCMMVLRWAGLGSRNLPILFYRVHYDGREPDLSATRSWVR